MAKRYTVLVADRATGAVRRFTVAVRPMLLALMGVLLLPFLVGLGARWQVRSELEYLRTRNATLEVENTNFRAATGQLTSQVWSLQQAVDELVTKSALSADVRTAMARLPDGVREKALGGPTLEDLEGSGDPSRDRASSSAIGGGSLRSEAIDAVLAATVATPQDTHDVLRLLIDSLQRRLTTVGPNLERQAALANATPSIWPALGWLSSGYGYRRDPFTFRRSSHVGLDVVGRVGDPVRASADGVVKVSGWDGGYGNTVTIAHGFSMDTRYAHLSRTRVKVGEQVQRGDIIGYVGSTGRATSAHLHYEVWINGRPVNPISLLASR
ncbi:MAG: peptidoglycan DD-metalloendopeptidase family protein [Luteitalea sp.]|nr:peptidoglycan DD-metalloendopeptidase family protein [Luteitalea sp.]